MSYELRAIVGCEQAAAQFARRAGGPSIALPQGLHLVPVTESVFDALGDGAGLPYEKFFWFLSDGIERLALEVSLTCSVAYLEADIFGGRGTQAAVAWTHGQVTSGPIMMQFGSEHDACSRSAWPINSVLRYLGVDALTAIDEFDAAKLGLHRSTDAWTK